MLRKNISKRDHSKVGKQSYGFYTLRFLSMSAIFMRKQSLYTFTAVLRT